MNDTQNRLQPNGLKSGRIKLGWILLLGLLLYSIFITSALQRTRKALNTANDTLVLAEQSNQDTANNSTTGTDTEVITPTSVAEDGLWMPIVGARVPQNPMWLPTAPRDYRNGESQGFDFYSDDAGVTIAYGTPVIASDDGVLTRIDIEHEKVSEEQWEKLMAEVELNGASEEQLDILRGRQIWLKTKNGQVLRYAHLSAVRNGLTVNQEVYRGQVIGYVGNSGTENAVKGDAQGVRLHFEIWESEDEFFGKGLSRDDIQIRSPRLFVGP